ncbi:MAG: radical SAM family heme chaperone HemW [Elusimicrobiota bacterium]
MHHGLYVHIPFCDAKCSYCDFVTFVGLNDQIDRYLKALEIEASSYNEAIDTLFIGGGTPSVLSPIQIDQLFQGLKKSFDFAPLKEATVEMNPESATEEKFLAFKKNGINRISFGLQATQNAILSHINRLHSYETFLKAYSLARKLGFYHLNIDLILGLPHQTLKDWENTLTEIIQLNPEHISTYALKVEPNTDLGKNHFECDSDLQADMYLMASEKLISAGYEHYEISNFSKPGRASLHNLKYWKNEPTVGLGVSATGYLGKKRRKNTPRLPEYLNSLEKGEKVPQEIFELSDYETEKEFFLLGLRLKEGVSYEKLMTYQIPKVKDFLKANLAEVDKGRFKLKPAGWLLSNQLFSELV